MPLSDPPADPVVLDSPLTGEWFVFNSGRSGLINGHAPNEGNAIDFMRLGANGRTHTGGAGAPLTDYAGFGSPLLAPADGRIVGVTDDQVDTPPGPTVITPTTSSSISAAAATSRWPTSSTAA